MDSIRKALNPPKRRHTGKTTPAATGHGETPPPAAGETHADPPPEADPLAVLDPFDTHTDLSAAEEVVAEDLHYQKVVNKKKDKSVKAHACAAGDCPAPRQQFNLMAHLCNAHCPPSLSLKSHTLARVGTKSKSMNI